MKQQMLSYLSTITDEIFSISNYILKNGEEINFSYDLVKKLFNNEVEFEELLKRRRKDV